MESRLEAFQLQDADGDWNQLKWNLAFKQAANLCKLGLGGFIIETHLLVFQSPVKNNGSIAF